MFEQYDIENKLLKKYGWWYFPDFPNDLMLEIMIAPTLNSTETINTKICEYYTTNNFEKLDALAAKWITMEYFSRRAIDLYELNIIYKNELYNAAITISMTIIEGILRDFISKKQEAYYQFKTVRKSLKDIVNLCDDFFNDELDIISHVIQLINDIYDGNFSPANPDEYSDLLRDKRMHGQAYGKQTKTDSLKMILLIDELFYILSVIDEAE